MQAILPTAHWQRLRRWCGEQFAATSELRSAMAIGEKPDVTNAVEAIRHGVLEEAADELVGRQCHYLCLAVMTVVLPGETDLVIVVCHEAAVGDGDAMSVSAEIAEHLLGAGKRRLGEDHPVDTGQFVEQSSARGGVLESCECAGQAKLTSGKDGTQLGDEYIAEPTGEH